MPPTVYLEAHGEVRFEVPYMKSVAIVLVRTSYLEPSLTMYMCIYIYRDREREREQSQWHSCTIAFSWCPTAKSSLATVNKFVGSCFLQLPREWFGMRFRALGPKVWGIGLSRVQGRRGWGRKVWGRA